MKTLTPEERKLLLMGVDDDVDWRHVGKVLNKSSDAARVQYGRLIVRLRKTATSNSEGDTQDA